MAGEVVRERYEVTILVDVEAPTNETEVGDAIRDLLEDVSDASLTEPDEYLALREIVSVSAHVIPTFGGG